ncbi:ATP-grasp domain-containing protein [Streptomyces sp. NBC_01439]|uniref:ATP-grasp domain-containing protein n=1 Tax=Streptomyces sp. NBC_01439 TaxID=2903867 RepID=UPI002E2B1805|nr:hypothetical protein [Streptomyces sp. NBC_01439]
MEMSTEGSRDAIAVIGLDPQLLHEAVRRGLRTVMVRDTADHLRGTSLRIPPGVEEVVVEDVTDVGDVWAGLSRHFGDRLREDLRGIVTFDEFAVSTVAALAALLKLPGTPLGRAVLMRDKHLQKQAVLAAGLTAARSRVVVPGSPLTDVPFPGPCVVKPLAGGGTTATEAARSEEEYRALLERLAPSATTPFVVEDLVDVEREWIVDGVVQNGTVVFSSVGSYAEPCLEYTTDTKPLTVYRADGTGEDERCEEARAFAGKALHALGYDDGVFHLELLQDRATGAFWFGECAARVGGALIQEGVMAKHGFSLARSAVEVALGVPVSGADEDTGRYVATTSLHLPRGTVMKVPDPQRFCAPEYVHEVRIAARLGVTDTPAVRSTVHWQGLCLVSADSAEDLEVHLEAVRSAFVEQSMVAPTFGTGRQVRAFMDGYEEMWRQQL